MELKKGENEYYLTNKHKIDLKVIYTWKYFPVGDSMRKTYDYNYIPLEGFLERYYKHFDNNNWHRWINTIVKPLYDGNPKEWKSSSSNTKPMFGDWLSVTAELTFTRLAACLKKSPKFNVASCRN